MSTQAITLNSLVPDTLTPAQQQIFDELSRESPGWMGHEKYFFGTRTWKPHQGNPMFPEAIDDQTTILYMFGTAKERRDEKFEHDKGLVVRQSREFLIARYMLSEDVELLNSLHRESPQVTRLTGELRRYAERFHGISRYDAKVTGDLVVEYCGRFNLPRLTPLLFERLGFEQKG